MTVSSSQPSCAGTSRRSASWCWDSASASRWSSPRGMQATSSSGSRASTTRTWWAKMWCSSCVMHSTSRCVLLSCHTALSYQYCVYQCHATHRNQTILMIHHFGLETMYHLVSYRISLSAEGCAGGYTGTSQRFCGYAGMLPLWRWHERDGHQNLTHCWHW